MRARAAAVMRYRVESLEPRVLLAADWTAGLAPSWSPDAEALASDTDLFATLSDPPEPGALVSDPGVADASPVKAPQAAFDLEALRTLGNAAAVDAAPLAVATPGDPAAADSAGRHELIVIDAGVSGYEQLIADLRARASEDVRVDVQLIESGADGVQALTALLSEYSDLDAVHVVSHGTAQGLQLGASWLDAASVERDGVAISAWSSALAEGADLMLYGCNLASSPDGLALVERLAHLTGADVAASEDLTGAAALDGDWHLEFATDTIEASVPFSPAVQQAWQGVLAYTEAAEVWSPTTGGSWETKDLSAGPFSVPANAVLEIAISNGDSFSSEVGGVRASGSTVDRVVTLSGADASGADYVVMHVQANAASQIETYANDTANVRFTLLGYWDSGVYVETAPAASTFQVAGGATWEDHSLSAFGVGANDVVEVLLSNSSAVNDRDAGVRTDGSTLDRLVDLSSTENGGSQFDTMFVQAGDSASATIEAFARNKFDIAFTVLGYWSTAPDVYVEAIADIGTPAADATWSSVDLSSFGIPGDTVVEISFGNDQGGASDNELGVRETGSSLDFRRLDLRQPDSVTGSGPDRGRMHVNADAASAIEFYHTDASDQYDFLLTGYWSAVAPVISSDPLWLSTRGDVTSGGQPGNDTWQDEDLILIGDPNLAFGTTTNGTFEVAFDATPYAPTADLNATHVVTRNMVVGASSFLLKAGDLLLSTVDDTSTFTSSSAPTASGFTNNLTVNNEDVFIFRPDVFGDYSAGTFAMLLDNATGTGGDVVGISLIERDVTVGDADLEAGDFLYTRFGDNDVFLFDTLEVGVGITNGARSVLLEGNDLGISISNTLFGIDVVEKTVTLGGQVLASGTVLLTSEFGQNVGANNLAVTDFDVYALDVKKTTLVSGVGNGLASASMVFEGSDVGFNTVAEELRSITLTTVHNAAPVLMPAAPSLTPITEDDTGNTGDLVSAIVGATITDDDADDPQGIAITGLNLGNGTWEYSTDGGSSWNAVGAVADGSALLLRATDRVRFVPDAEMADTATITYRAWDQSVGTAGDKGDASGFGGSSPFSKDMDTAAITVSAVNDAPTLPLPARVFINEIHYDNVGVDAGEAVEIAAPAGTDLTGFSLVFYNGFTGSVYRTEAIAGVVPDQGDSFGTLVVNLPVDGIQNAGSGADGVALVDAGGSVLEFISYEGSFVAVDGPAGGTVSTDIGVTEDGATPVGHSLQLAGAGPAFTWSPAAAHTLGTVNTGQSFAAAAAALGESVVQDGTLVFAAASGNAITVADVDELESGVLDPLAMSLSVSNGTVTLGSTTGLVNVIGDGSATLTFQGTAAELNTVMDGLTYRPDPGFSGTDMLTIIVDDQGNTGPPGALVDKGQVVIEVTPPSVMWLTTKADEPSSDALGGGESWLRGDVVSFGDGATFGASPNTTGSFANQFSFTGINAVTSNPEQADLRALHYVGTSVTLGSGGDTFTVQAGDVIAAIDNTDTIRLTSSNASTIDVTRKDIFVFRPDTPGDYTSGVFTLLLTNPLNNNIHAITLVEEATHLGAPEPGDANLLNKGDFLVAYSGPGDHDDVYKFTASKVVTATDAGTATKMLEGSVLGFSDQIQGLDLVEVTIGLGDTTLAERQLLVSLNKANTVAGLSVNPHDVFVLDITGTEAGAGTAAVATMLFDGSDVSLETPSEAIDGLTLAPFGAVHINTAPTATNLTQVKGYVEDAVSVMLDDIVVTDADAGDTITAALTLADVTAGTLSAGSGNGETYNAVSGVWTVSGTLGQVNAALAAVAFLPASDSAVDTTIATHVEDQAGDGPGDGVITLVATPVNDEPSFTVAGSQAVAEDSGPHTVVGFATPAAGGGADESGQSFTYTVSNNNAGLFAVGPAIDAAGTLTYTLNPNVSGAAAVTVSVRDDGGTANGGDDTSGDQIFDIIVAPVNDEPSFTTLGNQAVDEDSGPHTVAGFATPAPGGGADEAGQTFTYTVSNDNAGLFAVGPAIDASGTLTYTLNPNVSGTATVTVSVRDDGGTANGGDDTSPDQSFDIVVAAVNDEPSFTALGDQNVLEDSGPHTVAGFATPAPGGGADEAGQSFSYTVSNNNAGLFAVGPVIDASGTLTYTLNPNVSGVGAVTVSVRDDGGTANGGDDTSPDQTFDIVVAPVNDEPSFTTLGNQNVLPGSGTHSVAGFATPAPGGGADEAGQSFTYTVSSDNAALFAVAPAIDASGTLSYTLNPSVTGSATVTVSARDDGGTANGGDDTSPNQSFNIVVTAFNTAPDGADATRIALEDTVHVFAVGDFGFSDADGHSLQAVRIASLPGAGTLSHGAGVVSVGDVVSKLDIAAGKLVFTPSPDASGAGYASFTFQVQDDGGTASGGVDLDPTPNTIIIDVTAVNDEPSFTTLGNQSVNEDSGPHTVAGFATSAPGGGGDEAGQSFTYTVSNDNAALFAVAPAIDAAGTLTYTLNPNVSGSATVTVSVRDDGGTANGGDDTSPSQAFDIVITPVNDPPSGANTTVTTAQDTGYVFLVSDFGFSDPAEGNALLGVEITTLPGAGLLTNAAVALSLGDTVSAADIAAGRLVFTPVAGANGAAYAGFAFLVQDDGGTANGGLDRDPSAKSLTIDVTPVAAPVVPPADPPPVSNPDPVSDPPPVSEPSPVSDSDPDEARVTPRVGSPVEPDDEQPPADSPSPDPEPPASDPSGELPTAPSDGEVATPLARTPVVLASDIGVVGQPDSTPPTPTSSGPKDGAAIAQAPIQVVPKVEPLLGPSDLETADGERPGFVAIRAGIALALDRVRNSMDEESGVRRFELGQSTGAALGLSVGYVSWLLRGGVLLSSVLSSLPAWRFIDPLPVFSAMRSRRAQDDGEDESLEEIVEGAPDNERAPPSAPADDTAAHTPAAQVTIAEPPFAPASRPTAPGPGP